MAINLQWRELDLAFYQPVYSKYLTNYFSHIHISTTLHSVHLCYSNTWGEKRLETMWNKLICNGIKSVAVLKVTVVHLDGNKMELSGSV